MSDRPFGNHDPGVFLETVAMGRTVCTHPKRGSFLLKATPANSVFYIREGKVKVAVLSKQARKRLLLFWERTNFWVKDV